MRVRLAVLADHDFAPLAKIPRDVEISDVADADAILLGNLLTEYQDAHIVSTHED